MRRLRLASPEDDVPKGATDTKAGLAVFEVMIEVIAPQGPQPGEGSKTPALFAVVDGIVQAVVGHIPEASARKQR